MDMVLITIGLLLIATAVTLMWHRQRTWLVAIAQGLGIQGLIAIGVSAAQVALVNDRTPSLPMEKRVQTAVAGMAFNAGGWASRQSYEFLGADPDEPARGQLDIYLVVFAVQAGLFAIILGARLMGQESDHRIGDPVMVLFVALLLANSIANVTWEWWEDDETSGQAKPESFTASDPG